MAIAILADTTQIARLVVPKALLLQSAQVVQSRIGGLVGREIRHISFSRRTPLTDEILGLYRELHREIREESGVLLTTSEHMLSFKLSGLQRLVDSKITEADTMIRFQETLTRYSRDVIDESDFTLAVKTQLIYPVSFYPCKFFRSYFTPHALSFHFAAIIFSPSSVKSPMSQHPHNAPWTPFQRCAAGCHWVSRLLGACKTQFRTVLIWC